MHKNNTLIEVDHLFLSQRGGSLQLSAIYHLVTPYAYETSLEDATPHTSPHTFEDNLVHAAVLLHRVAHIPGHDSVATTTIYTISSQQDLHREVQKTAFT